MRVSLRYGIVVLITAAAFSAAGLLAALAAGSGAASATAAGWLRYVGTEFSSAPAVASDNVALTIAVLGIGFVAVVAIWLVSASLVRRTQVAEVTDLATARQSSFEHDERKAA